MRCARCSTSRTVSPRSRIARERLEDDVDDRRREPERRLVEQQHVGRARRARGRSRAAAAGRPRARRPCRRRKSCDDREELVDRSRCPSSTPSRLAPPGEAEPEVLLDGELGEDAAALGHERDARAARRSRARARGASCPCEQDLAAARRHEPHDRVQRRRLAGAVRPDQADDLAASTSSDEVAHGGDAAVGDVERRRAPASRLGAHAVLVHGALAEVRRGDVEVARGSRPAFPRRASGPGRARGSGRRRP